MIKFLQIQKNKKYLMKFLINKLKIKEKVNKLKNNQVFK